MQEWWAIWNPLSYLPKAWSEEEKKRWSEWCNLVEAQYCSTSWDTILIVKHGAGSIILSVTLGLLILSLIPCLPHHLHEFQWTSFFSNRYGRAIFFTLVKKYLMVLWQMFKVQDIFFFITEPRIILVLKAPCWHILSALCLDAPCTGCGNVECHRIWLVRLYQIERADANWDLQLYYSLMESLAFKNYSWWAAYSKRWLSRYG